MNFKSWLAENFFQGAGIYVTTPRGKETYSVEKLAKWAAQNIKPQNVTIDWLKNNISDTPGSGYTALHTDLNELPQEGTDEYTRSMQSNTKYPILIVKEAGETWVGDGNHRIMKARLTGQNQLPAYIIDASQIPAPNEL
jgi:hypothetical protein